MPRIAIFISIALVATLLGVGGAAADTEPPQEQVPPAVTLLFSRSELGPAIDCVEDRTAGTVWLDTVVAPEIHARGFSGVGSVETSQTWENVRPCLHYRRTIGMSWKDAASFRDDYGWTFISHGRSRTPLTSLTDEAITEEVSGSLSDLHDHGHLRASGMYAYQNNRYDERTQAIVRRYYDFGRTYKWPVQAAVNTPANIDPQRFQWTSRAAGGQCKLTVPECMDNSYTPVTYKPPSDHVEAIASLQPGQWLTIQTYVLVEGFRPGEWDCRSADIRLHWTSDSERYCWSDYLKILDALSARPDVHVTDPYTVARNWYGDPSPEPTEPSPDPSPDPSPEPTEPSPDPSPEPTEPSPDPSPAPTEPSPDPSPDPSPAPTEPSPDPSPDPSPAPTEPSPDPSPDPSPEPTGSGPDPSPDPSPEPTGSGPGSAFDQFFQQLGGMFRW